MLEELQETIKERSLSGSIFLDLVKSLTGSTTYRETLEAT